MKNTIAIKVTISLVALVGIVVRLIWPDLKIDVVTLGLLALFILPWLTSIVESTEFPGGVESQVSRCTVRRRGDREACKNDS